MTYNLTPAVNTTQEFLEIAQDFSNPLDLVREAISNSFDAQATEIKLFFDVVTVYGDRILKIVISDNGTGMDNDGLQAFFDLGNSSRKASKETTGAIGEKGHGTKVFFNSKKIEVRSVCGGKQFTAIMEDPRNKLFDHIIPDVSVSVTDCSDEPTGTTITIMGYNSNRREKFTHDQLKDYILWFTKFGSVEQSFNITKYSDCKLQLKGIDRTDYETLDFGHIFPNENSSVQALFDEYMLDAPKWYCKKIVKTHTLRHSPEIRFEAVFYVEGTKVKYSYNPMLRRSGYSAPEGAYTVQDRYGLWLCKDYIPIQRKNEWIVSKGSEFTSFHAFVNCQALKLTANRGSIENTPTDILTDLRDAVREIYEEIIQSDDWANLSWLESEVESYNTIAKERREFQHRIEKVNRTRIADYTSASGQSIHLIEPQQENGVFTIFMQLSALDANLFPFTVVDYDTHFGIDVIVKGKDLMPIRNSRLYYVEFKNYLTKNFNHSFENLHSIVCWDINTSELKSGEEVIDIAEKKRTLRIIPPEARGDYTRYYLEALREERRIEVFVLKYYLEEKYGITFNPRNEASLL